MNIYEGKTEVALRKRQNKHNQKEIIKVAVEARQHDMSYGQYVGAQLAKQVVIVRRW